MSKWKIGICDCDHELGMFFTALCCAPIAVAINADNFHKSAFLYGCGFLCCGGPIISCLLRGQIRKELQIDGNCCDDLCYHCCCFPCAIAQEAYEINQSIEPKTMKR